MKIRELLVKHGELDRAIKVKLEVVQELKALATKVTASVFSGGGSGHSDRVGRTTARIVDLENEVNEDIDRFVEIKAELHGIISALENERDRLVIERRYILGESWERVAENMGYSPRHIKRLHNQIIEKLEKISGGAA